MAVTNILLVDRDDDSEILLFKDVHPFRPCLDSLITCCATKTSVDTCMFTRVSDSLLGTESFVEERTKYMDLFGKLLISFTQSVEVRPEAASELADITAEKQLTATQTR